MDAHELAQRESGNERRGYRIHLKEHEVFSHIRKGKSFHPLFIHQTLTMDQ